MVYIYGFSRGDLMVRNNAKHIGVNVTTVWGQIPQREEQNICQLKFSLLHCRVECSDVYISKHLIQPGILAWSSGVDTLYYICSRQLYTYRTL